MENGFGERCHDTTVPGSLRHMNTASHKVYLVRHGEVQNPDHVVYADLPGFPLSATGRRQVAHAADRLPSDATVVTSPVERAVETATILAERRKGRLVLDASLLEWGLGMRWAGHTWESLDDVFPGERRAYLDHPEDLPFLDESLGRLARRVTDAVRRHQATVRGPLIVVSHQDPLQAARLSLTGRPLADLNRDKPKHAGVVELAPRSLVPWFECAAWAPYQTAIES